MDRKPTPPKAVSQSPSPAPDSQSIQSPRPAPPTSAPFESPSPVRPTLSPPAPFQSQSPESFAPSHTLARYKHRSSPAPARSRHISTSVKIRTAAPQPTTDLYNL